MKKILLLLVLLVLAGSMVFAGGSKEKAATTLRWSYWGGETRIRAIQAAVDEYYNRTGVVIAAEVAPGTDDHFNKVRTQFVGGNAPDIIAIGGDFNNLTTTDKVSSDPTVGNWLLTLDDYINRKVIDASKIDAAAIAAGTRDGKVYGIGVATNMPALLYNKALLQRIGAPLPNVSMTWTEFEAWMTAVKARLPANTYVLSDFGSTNTGSSFFGYWAGQNGTSVWDGTKTSLTAAAVQQYLEMWARWRTAGLVPPAAVAADYAEANEASSSMIAGRTVVTMGWSNNIVAFQNATRDELDLIEPPNAAVSKGLWGQMSQMIGVTKNSKNPEAAAAFINYFLTDPISVGKILTQYGIPVSPAGRAAVAAAGTVTDKKQAAYLDVAGNHAGPRSPNVPGDTEWNSGLFLIYQNVAYGRITTAAGAQQVMDLINRLIAASR
jgi:multiple sugar transport system substrate-binding protein